MGNDQQNYENDPYIKQSQSNNYAVKDLYTNSTLTPYSIANEGRIDQRTLSEQQKKVNTQAFNNPLKIDRNSIKLEKDAYNQEKYYLTFNYSAPKNIFANFYFNASFDPAPQNNMFYTPSPMFQSCIIRLKLDAGEKKDCRDSILFFDMDYFLKNKIYDKKYSDVVIELFSLDDFERVECILATFCKVIYNNRGGDCEIKGLYQKCKVGQSEWYNLQDIYNLAPEDEENLCNICYSNKKNTFFEPCKHSFACKDCAMMLRVKGNGCPICRNAISDSVVLETK